MIRIAAFLLLVPVSVAAQHHGGHSGHTGHQDREIKALPDEEAQSLLDGDGMGYALAAELNHHPGPRHVLDLRDELSLTREQVEETRRIFEEMHERARKLGGRLVEAERELDRLFREGEATEERVEEVVGSIGELEARLRYAHLEAHLRTTALLSPDQIRRYDHERGYAHDGH